MGKRKINNFRLASICFAVSGACFIILSMMSAEHWHLPIGMSLTVLGMVFSGLALKQEKDDKDNGTDKESTAINNTPVRHCLTGVVVCVT